MFTALQTIDDRFKDLIEGGRSPNLASGWRPFVVAQDALEEALRRSDRASAKRGYKGTPRRDFGAWNGQEDEGWSAAVGFVVEGTGPPSAVDLRSFASASIGTEGLTPDQVEGIVHALVDPWNPDEGKRVDQVGDTERESTYTRGEGWKRT